MCRVSLGKCIAVTARVFRYPLVPCYSCSILRDQSFESVELRSQSISDFNVYYWSILERFHSSIKNIQIINYHFSCRQKSITYGRRKSSSDSELAQTKDELSEDHRKSFLDGLTVDELSRYRRRRIRNHHKDTLGIAYPFEPLNKNEDPDVITEYRRAFCTFGHPIRQKAKSEDNIKEDAPVTMNLLTDLIKRPPLIRR